MGSQNWAVTGSPRKQHHHLLPLGQKMASVPPRQQAGGQRALAGQGLLSHGAVGPSHPRWLLCVSGTEEEGPR